jgi:tetratricopeptide (TPR) repeat protein
MFFGFANKKDINYWRKQIYKKISVKEVDIALKVFTKAIESEPESAQNYFDRGWLLLGFLRAISTLSVVTYELRDKIIRYKEIAVADFEKSSELNPENDKAFGCLGDCHAMTQDYENALLNYSKAIELNENFANHYHNRGWVYWKRKEYELAKADLKQALSLDPHTQNSKMLLLQIEKESN